MSAHTPGPWGHVLADKVRHLDWVAEVGQFAIVSATKVDLDASAEPDAALIAAAPETAAERDRLREVNAELLAALEEIRKTAQRAPLDVPAPLSLGRIEAITRAAIAQAEGRA